jgi:hypothetical protein
VVGVHDARLLDPPASLDEKGFPLVEHVSGVGIALVNSGLGRDRLIDTVEVFVDSIASRLLMAPC